MIDRKKLSRLVEQWQVYNKQQDMGLFTIYNCHDSTKSKRNSHQHEYLETQHHQMENHEEKYLLYRPKFKNRVKSNQRYTQRSRHPQDNMQKDGGQTKNVQIEQKAVKISNYSFEEIVKIQINQNLKLGVDNPFSKRQKYKSLSIKDELTKTIRSRKNKRTFRINQNNSKSQRQLKSQQRGLSQIIPIFNNKAPIKNKHYDKIIRKIQQCHSIQKNQHKPQNNSTSSHQFLQARLNKFTQIQKISARIPHRAQQPKQARMTKSSNLLNNGSIMPTSVHKRIMNDIDTKLNQALRLYITSRCENEREKNLTRLRFSTLEY